MQNLDFQKTLGRLQRRVRGIAGLSGLAWGALALLLAGLCGVWADLVFELSPASRLTAMGVAVALGPLLAIWFAWRGARRAVPSLLAQRLDQAGSARGEIVAGVDLLHDTRVFEPRSAGLAEIAVERAATLAREVPRARVAPWRPVVAPALATGLASAGVLLLTLALPRLADALWQRFKDPYGDHPPYSAVRFRVEPGDLQVVYGQGAEIRAIVEGAPVDGLALVLEPAGAASERVPMFQEASGRWRAALANVTAPGRYFVTAERARARSSRHKIDVITVPRLTGVRFRVSPPAYTRRSAYEGGLPSGGLTGLAGTRVEAWASSNRPLASGTLLLSGGSAPRTVELVPTAPGAREVYGSFDIKADAKLEIRVRDLAAQQSQDALSASVVLLHDERPFIRINDPRELSFATPDVMLPVVLAAEDDCGIARVQLFRALNGSRALPLDLPLGGDSPTRWNDQIYLPLAKYGMRPGDEISLFARVEDNDPAGAKGSESAVARVRIIPREVYDRLVQARQGVDALAARYREAERRLEALAGEIDRLNDELAKLPAGSTLEQAKQTELKELARRFRDETAAIAESARHPLPIAIDQNLSRELEKLAKALAELTGEAEKLASQTGLSNKAAAERLAELRDRLTGGRKQLEQNALAPLEHLASVYPLMEDQARFAQLYLHQRDLAERLTSFKGHDREDEPAKKGRMRDLEAEQKQIGSELARLLDDIEEHARVLPDDPQFAKLRETAQAFATGVRSSGATEAMTDAEEALASFAGTRSFDSAKNAADILEKFLSQCSSNGDLNQAGQGCLVFQPGLAGNLGDSIEQMLAQAGFPSLAQIGKPGFGTGAGTGNGYSARQNNMNNVGLYGSLPTLVSSPRQGRGQTDAAGGRGRAQGTTAHRRSPELNATPGATAGAGRSQADIPIPYRRRVADYFERIADELGDR